MLEEPEPEELLPPLEELPLPEEEPPPEAGLSASNLQRTMQEADRPVLLSVTVMVAVPGATAVTSPLLDTVAAASLSEVQV